MDNFMPPRKINFLLGKKPKKVKGFFDDSDFRVIDNLETVKMIGAVFPFDEVDFCQAHKEICQNLEIAEDIEIKWNADSSLRAELGEKYDKYKDEFMGLIIQSFTAFIGVSGNSKSEALRQLINGASFNKKYQFVFDFDLIEDERLIPKICTKNKWSFENSAKNKCLQAADFFTGSIKLLIQQNSGIHERHFLIKTPGYGTGITSAEFLIRMQTRWMMEGPVKENDESGNFLPIRNCIGHSVFLAPDLHPEIKREFERHFENCYMGCTQ